MGREAEATEALPRIGPATLRGGNGSPRRVVRRLLRTDDGVAVDAVLERRAGSAGPRPGGLAIVVAHGFTGSLERPALRRASQQLSRHADVVAFSFRGHGRSGGRSTLGDLEVLDLAAAVRWARSLGYARVATVGFSMGGSVVLRHAALYRSGDAAGGAAGTAPGPPGRAPARSPGGHAGAHTDAVVAVSAPARWYYRGTAPMRRLHWAVQRPAGRLFTRYGLRTRVHHRGWDPVPVPPVEAVPRIAPTPLLVVHGDRDAYFPLDHPRSLAAAAGPAHADLWIEPGFGHAENAAPPELLERIGAWAAARTGTAARHDGAGRTHG